MSEGAAERQIRLPTEEGSGSSGTYGTESETREAGSVSTQGVASSWTGSEVVCSATWSSAPDTTTGTATGKSGVLVSLGAGLAGSSARLMLSILPSFKISRQALKNLSDRGSDLWITVWSISARALIPGQKVPNST